MQGFIQMLKTVGLDPDKMMADMQAVIDQFEARRAAEHKAIMDKFDSLDRAIKSLDKTYVPDEFKTGELVVTGDPEPEPVTNPDTPDGGAVDMTALDQDKLAAMDRDANAEQPTVETQGDGEATSKGGKKAKGG